MPVFAAWRVGAPPSVLSLVQQELEGTYREGGQEAKGRGPADLLGQSSGRMGRGTRLKDATPAVPAGPSGLWQTSAGPKRLLEEQLGSEPWFLCL